MAANFLGRGEGAAVVLLGFTDDDVDLGEEEQDEGDRGGQRDGHAHGDHLIIAPEVDGHKRHPDDARRVHSEAYELCLIEVFGEVPGFYGVEGTHDDEEDVKA